MTEFQQLRNQLLKRLIAGKIARDEYEWALAEIERHQSEIETASIHSWPHTSGSQRGTEGLLGPGMVLGSHTVIRMLGKGGMGEVWLTSEMVQDSDFYSVIKLLTKMRDDDANKVLAVFHRVRLLQHEHICPVYSLGHDVRIGYYFVMKYIEGVDLAKKALDRDRPLSRTRLAEILIAVARALDYAHSRDIIHRDIKPSNIMLNEDIAEIQVVDFGLAAHVHKLGSTINGTPKYMAPEQWTGEAQDGRTDQFALGVVAYELLSDIDHFARLGPLGSIAASGGVPAILAVSPDVNAVLNRSMAQSRDDRFSNCAEFVAHLVRALNDPLK